MRPVTMHSAMTMGLYMACLAAIPALAQQTSPATDLNDPHPWYWAGHWHLWHGGWAYWWAIPLLMIVFGAFMFYVGRWSAGSRKKNRRNKPDVNSRHPAQHPL